MSDLKMVDGYTEDRERACKDTDGGSIIWEYSRGNKAENQSTGQGDNVGK